MHKTVGMVSLGCPKNQVDSEVMLALLKREGYEIVTDSAKADIIIVNTCGFIGPAKEESIDAILEQGAYKTKGTCKTLIVTGCLAERYSDELFKEIPEIDAVVGTERYTDIVNIINRLKNEEHCVYTGRNDNINMGYMPRIITTGPFSAYIKIAEGCNNHCSYCIIPKLRGPYRSRDLNGLVEEAHYLVDNGVKEIIVVAQDTTRYGSDLNNGTDLVSLLKELCQIKNLAMIRLMYLYPEGITNQLISLMASEEKICNYMDIPIQHISSRILRHMNRLSKPEDIRRLLNHIKRWIPDAVIRTSLIVGFPGETDSEFNELADFVREGFFNHAGVFTYSQEEGTRAASFKNQISEEVKKERFSELMSIQRRISKKHNRERVGKCYRVLVEGVESENLYFGRSYGEAPDIDGLIYINSTDKLKKGDIADTIITNAFEYDLMGDKL